MSSSDQHAPDEGSEVDELLAADDAAEEIDNEGQDVAMDSDDDNEAEEAAAEEEELVLQNDSIAYFDVPQDSLFAIAQHPVHPGLVAVGGSAGQEEDAPGAGWLLDTSAAESRRPVLPPSFASAAEAAAMSSSQLASLFELTGHTDSINALCWTGPSGEYLVSGGLDGRMRVWKTKLRPGGGGGGVGVDMTFIGESQEVDEVNWIAACPASSSSSQDNNSNANTIALGASDGSVWVYTVDASSAENPLQIVQSYFLHTGPCTAGAWTPDGALLATVSEDSSLYVWDVWGQAAANNMVGDNGMTAVSLTGQDQRFEVEGGLYSVAIDPKATFVAVGGAGGAVKVVSLPRLASADANKTTRTTGGQILASLHTQADSVESLAVALTSTSPPTVLLAAGSVDGSICVYDATRRFAVRRHISGAHDDHSVVRLDFVKDSWLLTSCGMDGVVRRWDLRSGGVTGTNAAGNTDKGLQREWKGHRGDGEGGGVLGFVQGHTGERIVTAGDDGLTLVFEA